MSGRRLPAGCVICGKARARKVCDRCNEVHCCSKKHLKQHRQETCLPSSHNLSRSERDCIQALVRDLVDLTAAGNASSAGSSVERFGRVLGELGTEMIEEVPEEKRPEISNTRAHYKIKSEGVKYMRFVEAKTSFFVTAGGIPPLVCGLKLHYSDLRVEAKTHSFVLLKEVIALNQEVMLSAIEEGVIGVAAQFFNSRVGSQIEFRLQFSALSSIAVCLRILPGSGVLRKEMLEHGVLSGVIQGLTLVPEQSMTLDEFLLWEETKKLELDVLYLYALHNFGHKTAIVRVGGLQTIAKVFEANVLRGEQKVSMKELIELLKCRCQKCMESKYCNRCDQKATLACACGRVRYCSAKCQQKDRKTHKKLCKRARHTTATFADHVEEEYDVVKAKDDLADTIMVESLTTSDVVRQLRECNSANDALEWLLVFARCPSAEVVAENGFSALLDVMERYKDVAQVQIRACAVYCTFAEGFQDVDVVKSVLSSGGVRTILAAIKAHCDNVRLVGCATAALVTLAAGCDEEGKRSAVIPFAVVLAMKGHPDDYAIQCAGCGALWNLCMGNSENKVVVREAGGASAVMAAWEKFWDRSGELDERAVNFWTHMLEGYESE